MQCAMESCEQSCNEYSSYGNFRLQKFMRGQDSGFPRYHERAGLRIPQVS